MLAAFSAGALPPAAAQKSIKAGVRLAVNYVTAEDPELWHERIALCQVVSGCWVLLTPDRQLTHEDLATLGVKIIRPSGQVMGVAADNVYNFSDGPAGAFDQGDLAHWIEEAKAAAEIMGDLPKADDSMVDMAREERGLGLVGQALRREGASAGQVIDIDGAGSLGEALREQGRGIGHTWFFC